MEDARKGDGSATDVLCGEDSLAWLSEEDDTVSQLMEVLLDGEDDEDAPEKSSVRFVEDPYASPLVFRSSYVTINGNEESCGSSFSDSDSSVMVGIGRLLGGGVALGSSEVAAHGWVEARVRWTAVLCLIGMNRMTKCSPGFWVKILSSE